MFPEPEKYFRFFLISTFFAFFLEKNAFRRYVTVVPLILQYQQKCEIMRQASFLYSGTNKQCFLFLFLDIFCGSPICKFSTVGAFLCNLYYSSVTIRPLLLAEFSHRLEEIPQSKKKIQFFHFRSVNFLARFQPIYSFFSEAAAY